MAKQICKIRKGVPRCIAASQANGDDLLSSLGDGTGSKFGQAAKKIVGSAFDPDSFLDGQIYGNLLSVNKKYLLAKRKRVSGAFARVVTSVAWLLKEGVSEQQRTMLSYVRTHERAAILPDWRALIRQHPHQWVATEVFQYIRELRDILFGIDKATGGALSNDLPDRFRQWSESEKILLPSDVPHKFHGLDLAAAYPHAKMLYDQSAIIVAEFCTPPYGWKLAIAINVRKLVAQTSFAYTGFAETIKSWAMKEIYKQYLARLRVVDHKLDFVKLVPGLASEADPSTARSIMKGVLDRREVASKVFGSEAVADLATMLKETSERESMFNGSGEPEPADVSPIDEVASFDIHAANMSREVPASMPEPAPEEEDDDETGPPSSIESLKKRLGKLALSDMTGGALPSDEDSREEADGLQASLDGGSTLSDSQSTSLHHQATSRDTLPAMRRPKTTKKASHGTAQRNAKPKRPSHIAIVGKCDDAL